MKKIILLLLIAPVLGYGQVLTDVIYLSGENIAPRNVDTNFMDYPWLSISTQRGQLSGQNLYEERVIKYTVPENKLWKISHSWWNVVGKLTNNSTLGRIPDYDWLGSSYYLFLIFHNGPFSAENYYKENSGDPSAALTAIEWPVNNSPFIPGGTTFTVGHNQLAELITYNLVIEEYDLSNSSLSYNEPETIKNNSNTPVLFPNPTSSLLALNSDKEYDIEVYDMAGNKVMALTGNNINMEHLSTATYIVKATDKSNNEELTYKVVKN